MAGWLTQTIYSDLPGHLLSLHLVTDSLCCAWLGSRLWASIIHLYTHPPMPSVESRNTPYLFPDAHPEAPGSLTLKGSPWDSWVVRDAGENWSHLDIQIRNCIRLETVLIGEITLEKRICFIRFRELRQNLSVNGFPYFFNIKDNIS